MVFVELNGRIGNHLFQIAAGASYAKKNGFPFKVVCHDGYKLAPPDNCKIKDYIKQFRDNIFRNITIQEWRPGEDAFYYYEKDHRYNEIPYMERDILLYGTFQSEKYFDKELVRSLFAISPEIKEYILNKYGDILNKKVTAINVRRGDYCKLPHRYAVCSMSYYNRGINYLGKDKNYLIISDDIDWCKKHFKGNNFYFVEKEKPIIDLYIQTLCENNIISNSTFSWWGAWLNNNPNKIVIYPDPWFGWAYKDFRENDLIPEGWIKIKNQLSLGMKIRACYLLFIEKTASLLPQNIKKVIK